MKWLYFAEHCAWEAVIKIVPTHAIAISETQIEWFTTEIWDLSVPFWRFFINRKQYQDMAVFWRIQK